MWTEQLAPSPSIAPVRTSPAGDGQATVKYLVAGVLFIVAGGVVSIVFPLVLVLCIPGSIICFLRAFTLKTCFACRKDIPKRATTCPSCHAIVGMQLQYSA